MADIVSVGQDTDGRHATRQSHALDARVVDELLRRLVRHPQVAVRFFGHVRVEQQRRGSDRALRHAARVFDHRHLACRQLRAGDTCELAVGQVPGCHAAHEAERAAFLPGLEAGLGGGKPSPGLRVAAIPEACEQFAVAGTDTLAGEGLLRCPSRRIIGLRVATWLEPAQACRLSRPSARLTRASVRCRTQPASCVPPAPYGFTDGHKNNAKDRSKVRWRTDQKYRRVKEWARAECQPARGGCA